MDLKGKRVLIVATSGPEAKERCTAPFFFARAAALQGAHTSICFIMQSAGLLKQGVAEALYAKEDGQPLHEFIRLALKAGVEFYVCDAALKACDMSPDDLIEEAENLVGPTFLITQGIEADLVLNF
jgi:predicted peroxiredoxin